MLLVSVVNQISTYVMQSHFNSVVCLRQLTTSETTDVMV